MTIPDLIEDIVRECLSHPTCSECPYEAKEKDADGVTCRMMQAFGTPPYHWNYDILRGVLHEY